MKVVCAPDSFKESMDAVVAAEALAEGIHRVDPTIECVQIPLADGGEGFTASVVEALHGEWKSTRIHDAIGEPADARFAMVGKKAFLEVAQAVGIGMVPLGRRRVRNMTSYGVGELLRAAVNAGAEEIFVGLGGSGTNDGGAGMLVALGIRFLDHDGRELTGTPESLKHLERIETSGLDPEIEGVSIRVACDVDNPLYGAKGASAVFGPQKGASQSDVTFLDSILHNLATAAGHAGTFAQVPGAGAAGGLGYAFSAFLGGSLESGIALVMELLHIRDAINGASIVFTGEGAIDEQTLMGKALSGISRIANEESVPLVAFAGKLSTDSEALYRRGFDALVPIVDGVTTLDEALRAGPKNLANAAERAMRLIQIQVH